MRGDGTLLRKAGIEGCNTFFELLDGLGFLSFQQLRHVDGAGEAGQVTVAQRHEHVVVAFVAGMAVSVRNIAKGKAALQTQPKLR